MFEKIKSLFIVEEEGKESTTTEIQKEPAITAKNPTPTSNQQKTVSSSQNAKGVASKKFTDILLKALETNNLDGFDYMEYKRSLESLKKMSMDEKTRFQSAFAMAQTMGVSAQKLIQSVEHYIRVLRNEERKFNQAAEHQKTTQISNKKKDIENLQNSIKQKKQQIEALKKEIENDEKLLAKIDAEVNNTASKVAKTQADFTASYQLLLSQIEDDYDKMKNYLK